MTSLTPTLVITCHHSEMRCSFSLEGLEKIPGNPTKNKGHNFIRVMFHMLDVCPVWKTDKLQMAPSGWGFTFFVLINPPSVYGCLQLENSDLTKAVCWNTFQYRKSPKKLWTKQCWRTTVPRIHWSDQINYFWILFPLKLMLIRRYCALQAKQLIN